jgi:aminoglycoside phosphotransferase (APT) family kinase protein
MSSTTAALEHAAAAQLRHVFGGSWRMRAIARDAQHEPRVWLCAPRPPIDHRRRWIARETRSPRGRRALAAMLAASRETTRKPVPLTLGVPGVLTWPQQDIVYLEARVRGTRLDSRLSSDAAPKDVALAARALAELHALPLVFEPHLRAQQLLEERIRDGIKELQQLLPARQQETRRVYEFLQRCGDLGHGVAPLHGDYQPRNLLVQQERVWLLDWEWATQGDPAFDVGYFVAYLDAHCPAHRAELLGSVFLDAYRDAGGVDCRARLTPYLVFNALRRATRRARLRDTNWQQEADRMVQRAVALTRGASVLAS